jgi:uncharacterized cysteine cluster protein YcgN (CxxCxxCC family)
MVELKFIITDGYVSSDTIEKMTRGGWNFVCTVSAKTIHPHAMDTNKASIFSKYIPCGHDDSESSSINC